MTRSFKLPTALTALIAWTALCLAGSAAAQDKLPYGLKAGKPYAGTKLIYLLPHADQFLGHQKRTPEFTQLTGIEVEYRFTPFPNLREKITADGVAGRGETDLYCFLDAWGPSLKNFLTPLNDRIRAAGIDMHRYPPAYIKGGSYEGQTYGIPLRGHPQLLLYRKDVFEKLGLKPPTTWAELEATAKVIQEKGGLDGIAMYYGKGYSGQSLFVWYAYLKSNGGDVFDKSWKPIFNNPAGIEATQRYIDVMLKHQVAAKGSQFFSEYEASQAVAQDKAAMVIVWWWHLGVLQTPEKAKAVVNQNIWFAPVPAWEGKGKATLALSMQTGISSASKHRDAAWEYLKWASSPELEKANVTDKSDPKSATIVATQLATLKDPEVNKISGGLHAAAAESLAVSDTMPMVPEWPEVANALEVAISEIAGGAPVKAQLDKAAAEVDQIMKRAGYYK
jgi:multiple sugar transport system substrate-binding protein